MDRFRKRYVTLQDNFLFVFQYPAEDNDEPIDVIWLENPTIEPTEQTQLATFVLTTRERKFIIYAASEQIKESWMKALSFATPWYDDEDRSDDYEFNRNSAQAPASSLLRVARRIRGVF